MSVVRSAIVALVTGVVALWLVSAASTNTPAQETPPAGSPATSPPALDPPLFDLPAQADRLERGIAAARAMARSRRNPFEFGRPEPFEAPSPASPPAESLLEREPAGEPVPPLTLIGIAERREPATPVRIAILAAPDRLFLAAPGDTVLGHYQVVAVSSDAVELRDESSSDTFRLALP